jgi:SAM-dependent methyltransferase
MTEKDFKWRWAHVDESGRTDHYVDILNQSRADDDPAHFPNTLAWIDAQPGERVLEVGCGNGAVARALVRQVPQVGEIVAVDASDAMIAEARRRSAGKDGAVTFQVADAQQLPFSSASFDRAYTMETLVIVPDPYQAFQELARVTRPGGHICIWETDCDMRAILGSDLDLTRRLMRFVGDHEYNGAVARQAIGWCKERGWAVQVIPAVSVSEDLSTRLAALLHEWLADAQGAGILTEDETKRLLADIHHRQEAGTFLSYTVNFRITAVKASA